MADDANNLGDLVVSVTGDFSELQGAINDAAAVADTGATQIAASLSGITDASADVGEAVNSSLGQVGDAAETASGDLDTTAAAAQSTEDALSGVGDAAGGAVPPIEDAANALGDAGEHAEEAESGLSGLAEGFLAVGEALAVTEALKEFGEEALNAYGTVQSVTIGLTQLTGSAEAANDIIEQVKQLAATEPFAFPEIAPTVQKMVALGVSAEQIPGIMQAVANAAAATGNQFQQVANALDRMSLSGTAGARQLTTLGISADDLGAAMGVTADQVTTAFKALDQSARLDALQTALEKFAGSAEAQAQGISGQWQIFQNQFEEVMVAVGADIAPAVSALLGFGKSVLSTIQEATEAFQELPGPVKDVAVVIGLAVAAVAPLTLGLGALGLGLSAIAGIIPAYNTLMAQLGIATEAEAVAEGEAAVATEAHAAAVGAAIPEIEGLAAAEGEAGAAAEVGASAIGAGGLAGALLAIVAYALPAGLAIAVTAENVKTLSDQWTEFDQNVKTNSILAAINSGATIADLENIGASVKTLQTMFSGTGSVAATVMQQIAASTQTPIQTLEALGYSAEQIQTALKGVQTSAVTAWQAFQSGSTIDDMKQVGLNIDQITQKLNAMGAAAQQSYSYIDQGIRVLGSGFAQLGTAAQGVVTSQNALKIAYEAAQQSVMDLTAAQQSGQTVDKNGIPISQDLAAAKIQLTAANNAWNTSLGISATVQAPIPGSLAAIAAQTDANTATYNTNLATWSALVQAYASGQTMLNGVPVTLQNIATAMSNLSQATANITGQTQAWIGSADAVNAVVQQQAGALTTLQNKVDQTSAALAALQKSYQTGVIIPGQNAVATAAQVQQAFLLQQQAITALEKATDASAYATTDWAGVNEDAVTVIANGQTVVFGYTNAQLAAARAADAAAVASGGQASAVAALVASTTTSISVTTDSTAATNADTAAKAKHTVALGQNSSAVANNTNLKKQLTAAEQAHSTATIADILSLESQLTATKNQGLAMAVLNADGTTTVQTITSLAQITNVAAGAQVEAVGPAQAIAAAYGQVATAAQNATAKVQALSAAEQDQNSTFNASSIGGGPGGSSDLQSTSLANVEAFDLSASFDPLLGAFVNVGNSANAMAQDLANSTNQVVTIFGQTFLPATQHLADAMSTLQAEANATGQTITEDLSGFGGSLTTFTPSVSQAATATAALATAATSAAAAVTTTTPALTDAQNAFLSAANSGDAVVTAFSNLPSTVQDFLTGAKGTLVAYDDTTGALQYTTTAANGLTDTVNASVAPNELNTAATTSNTTATAAATSATTDNTTAVVETSAQVTQLGTTAQNTSSTLSAVQQASLQLQQAMAAYALSDTNANAAAAESAEAALNTAQAATETSAALSSLASVVSSTATTLTATQQAMQQLNTAVAAYNANPTNANAAAAESAETALNTAQLGSEASAGVVSWLAGGPSYVPANPYGSSGPLLPGQGLPSSEYGEQTNSPSTGVQLTVNVTGNTVLGAGGMTQLASTIGSQVTNKLRTVAGLKL